jgi:flagellar motor switch protein FliM
MLNHIIVGRVLTVEDHINDKLETKANIKSHHTCTPKRRPGNIIITFVKNAKNSTVFGLFQYSLLFIDFKAINH